MIPFKHYILPIIHCDIRSPTELMEAKKVSGGKIPDGTSYVHLPPESAKPIPFDTVYDDYESAQEIHHNLASHYKFDAHQARRIKTYSMSWDEPGDHDEHGNYHPFRAINQRIIHNKLRENDYPRIDEMDHLLNKHRTPQALTVWSGLGAYEHIRSVVANEKVRHPAYLSTSIRPKVGMDFSIYGTKEKNADRKHERHVMKIHIPEGHPGAYLGDYSDVKHEKEFLMPRNTVLHIDHKKREVADNGYDLIYIHHAFPEPT